MPLGAAALSGTSFPIDRVFTARDLGFDAPSANSLDAVSDRDFVIEFVADASILMVHLSRIAEELVLWCSDPFSFIQIGDAFCTGSSIMPQKKNPDVAELTRAKSGRVFGHLVAILTVMKGQPLAYNRDNQEDKELSFDTVDTVLACLEVMLGMTSEIQFQREQLVAAAQRGYSTATDLAEYLVSKGVPFRDAHEAVGKTVRYALEQRKNLSDLSVEELRRFHAEIREDVFDRLTVEGSVAVRSHVGGTAPSAVKKSVHNARERLNRHRELLESLPR
jgi:argininosuccinate lyase